MVYEFMNQCIEKEHESLWPILYKYFQMCIKVALHAGLCRWDSWNWDLNSPNQQQKALLWQFLEFPLRKKIIELPSPPQSPAKWDSEPI